MAFGKRGDRGHDRSGFGFLSRSITKGKTVSAFGKGKTAGPGGLSLGNIVTNIGSIAGAVSPLLGGKAKGIGDALQIGAALVGGGGSTTKKGGSPKAGLPTIIGRAAPLLGGLIGGKGGGTTLPSIGGGIAGGIVGDMIGDIFEGGGSAVACPAGFHPAKDGSGRCVRNRRMNPLNPRAFRRALRRMKGAKRFAREVDRAFPRARRSAPRRRSGSHSH